MNKSITSFVKSVFAGITFIAMSAAVQAAPISYTYEATGLHKTLSTFPFFKNTHQLHYDLTSGSWSNEGTPTSYNPDIDTLSSLSVTLNFKNLVGPILLSFDILGSSQWTFMKSIAQIDFSDLAIDPTLPSINLALTSDWSAATLTGYTLTFSGTRELAQQAVPVPTPSTLALLSVGLLGAGWFSRRRNETAHS